MRHSILWKLLGINILVIGFVTVIVWLAIDYLAAGYFVILMKKYNISPVSSHQMFIHSVHRYLLWATAAAIVLAVTLSFLLTKRVLGPLSQMADITRRIAAGDYSSTVPIRSHDEVGQLAEAFNRMAQSLRALEDLRKNLMINVAHELRTPLTNIQGYVEGLLDGVVSASRETFELLLEEALRLADLVESILRLAKADAARTDLRITNVPLAQVLDQALEAFLPQFQAKRIRVESQFSPEDVELHADPQKLSQVINNLLQNAVQYRGRRRYAEDHRQNPRRRSNDHFCKFWRRPVGTGSSVPLRTVLSRREIALPRPRRGRTWLGHRQGTGGSSQREGGCGPVTRRNSRVVFSPHISFPHLYHLYAFFKFASSYLYQSCLSFVHRRTAKAAHSEGRLMSAEYGDALGTSHL